MIAGQAGRGTPLARTHGLWRMLAWVYLTALTAVLVMPFPQGVPGSEFGRVLAHRDKLIHFSLYALLVAMVVLAYMDRARTRRFWLLVVALSIAHGVTTECIQTAVPSRYFDALDIAAATAGVVASAAVCFLVVTCLPALRSRT